MATLVADKPADAMTELLNEHEPVKLAGILGVHNAHVYRFRKDGHMSPTLQKAIVKEGYALAPPPERHRVALEVDTPDEAAALRALLARYGTRREVATALVAGTLKIVENGECDE